MIVAFPNFSQRTFKIDPIRSWKRRACFYICSVYELKYDDCAMSIACNPEINIGAKLHTALTIHRNGNELAYWGDWGAVYIAPVTYILSSPRNESRKWNIMLHWIHWQHWDQWCITLFSDLSGCSSIFTDSWYSPHFNIVSILQDLKNTWRKASYICMYRDKKFVTKTRTSPRNKMRSIQRLQRVK